MEAELKRALKFLILQMKKLNWLAQCHQEGSRIRIWEPSSFHCKKPLSYAGKELWNMVISLLGTPKLQEDWAGSVPRVSHPGDAFSLLCMLRLPLSLITSFAHHKKGLEPQDRRRKRIPLEDLWNPWIRCWKHEFRARWDIRSQLVQAPLYVDEKTEALRGDSTDPGSLS